MTPESPFDGVHARLIKLDHMPSAKEIDDALIADNRESLLRLMAPRVGDVRLVFDSSEWMAAGGDVGDNSQFWHPATIQAIKGVDGGFTATVRFHHDDRLNHGHFIDCMRPLS